MSSLVVMVMVLGPGKPAQPLELARTRELDHGHSHEAAAYSRTVDYTKPIPSWALGADADPSTWQSCKIPGWRGMALLENPICVWMGGVVGPSHASEALGVANI